jgi:hypothetical protein
MSAGESSLRLRRTLRRLRRRARRALPWLVLVLCAAGVMFVITNRGG